jgi:pilus assembly protein Flp/PilA
MSNLIARFVKDESGATAIEYGLIAALIALAIITGAGALGNALNAKFNLIASTVSGSGCVVLLSTWIAFWIKGRHVAALFPCRCNISRLFVPDLINR